MKLSENEKRDTIELLQECKPLPDKYRFLLFQDAREVELVRNGKTQEVCNLVLPFQTIEHIDEPRKERRKKALGNFTPATPLLNGSPLTDGASPTLSATLPFTHSWHSKYRYGNIPIFALPEKKVAQPNKTL